MHPIFEKYKNVRVIGKVDELSSWYLDAQYIIAPIFEGSGMKTKVAEAFMFGKKILATRSALAGYDNLPEYSYYLCNTSKEFIETFQSLVDSDYSNFDENIRNIYENKFFKNNNHFFSNYIFWFLFNYQKFK